MPRPKSPIPAYRKHSSGNARVTINGRDYLLGPYGTKASKREYDRLVAEYLASGRSTSFGALTEQLTMAMIMADYLAFAKKYYGVGATSEWHRIKLALRPVKQLYAGHPATEFGPQQYKSVRQRMIDNGLSRTGTNAHMKRIARMLKWAAAEGRLPASIYETLRLVPGLKRGRTEARETVPVKPVTMDVVDATIAHLTPVVADMVRAQLLIGCRPGEICKLTPAMIDRSGDVWTATLDEHKTAHHGHVRRLYIGPKAQAVLTKYLLRGEHECLFQPTDSVRQKRERLARGRKTPASCGNARGRKNDGGLKGQAAKRTPKESYTTSSYARAIKRAAEKAKVDHWSPNQLRHTRATEVRKSFGLEAAQITLGHSGADITQVYAERDDEKGFDVARKIG